MERDRSSTDRVCLALHALRVDCDWIGKLAVPLKAALCTPKAFTEAIRLIT